ncbi:hypothetical protein [Paenibacillus sp.]|uniref:hypothetical protein n=1 Tax=Paenibacillus sp. TaxID=58172 RepID=UPI002D6E2590|nr:hypothetical protein [Paenibacillus sp.]HZG57313.1 hypothetical protein [Paenibacillus sp.]
MTGNYVEKNRLCKMLEKLPPNYPVGTIYLNGQPVQVTQFSNLDNDLGYFVADGQVVVLDCHKIDGISFAPAEAEEEEEEEAQ